MDVRAIFFIPWIATYMVNADVDPCLQVSNDYIPNPTGRREDCAYSNVGMLGCDNALLDKWYKSEYKIATSAPRIGSCGTKYPIWINGTIPNVTDGIVNRVACVHNIEGTCHKFYKIELKNCSLYYAYHLVPTNACMERYCFEKSSSIPCTTTTTSTTTTAMPKQREKNFSEGAEVCITLPVFIAVVIVLVAVFAVVFTAALCFKRQMCQIVQSRPVTPETPLSKTKEFAT